MRLQLGVLVFYEGSDDYSIRLLKQNTVETVTLLSKLSEAKHHIEVKVEYGFHVTNLNIAQVKQKHGIIERENYNKAKSVDSKQPGCPEEKVKAIEDAMRHFQMI